MGIDNDAILVYGWVFSYEEFYEKISEILQNLGINTNDDKDDLFDLFGEWLYDHHPDFIVG